MSDIQRVGRGVGDMIDQGMIERVPVDVVTNASNVVSDQMLASMAISAKRQADAVVAIANVLTGGGDNAALHGMISNLMWEAGRSFQAGTRTDR